MTRTRLGFSAWCKNRGSSIGDSFEEEDGFIDVEASVEPFAFVAEAIDGDWWLKNQLQLPENKIFSRTEKDFLGKIEKEKKNAKPYKNLGIFSDTISHNQELKTVYFIDWLKITQAIHIYVLICTGVNTKLTNRTELTNYYTC